MCRVTVVPVLMYGTEVCVQVNYGARVNGAEVCVQGHCGASVNVWSRGVCAGSLWCQC